jgi:hypothetical protein
MKTINRRNAIRLGLLGCSALLFGCGPTVDLMFHGTTRDRSSEPTPAPAPSPTGPQAWNVNPWPFFLAGSGATFDLAATLPSGPPRGGTFGVDARSPALPAGMTLSPAGILSVGSSRISQTEGVIFTYTEPAS